MAANPIDKDKTTNLPGLLPYAHHIGSAIIKPLDKGKTKAMAMNAMYEQTSKSLQQIKEQVELLISQAQKIHDRITASEEIYSAECSYEPSIGQIYHLYKRKNGSKFLSLIAPGEWEKNNKLEHICSAKLLPDHTWDIID
jgi:hypothetical protein